MKRITRPTGLDVIILILCAIVLVPLLLLDKAATHRHWQ